MKILFTTDRRDGPSTMWYEGQLRGLQSIPGVEIDFYNRNYGEYDVVLFMGYDPRCREAKRANPKAKVGVIDIRPTVKQETEGADFIIANGIEMHDWYMRFTAHVFVYPPYPILPYLGRKGVNGDAPVVLAYHGNKVHLQGMYPRITRAIEELAKDRRIEFRALYNIDQLGEWKLGVPDHPNIMMRHIQWTEDGYERLLEGADIGIVPNFVPLHTGLLGESRSISKHVFNDDSTDYLTRYKATSNAGRIFVFAQKGIPVVSDMFPSALQLIDDGVDGFLCYSTAAWFRALDRLSSNSGLASTVGDRLKKKYESRWSPEVLNNQLVEFLSSVPINDQVLVFEGNNRLDRSERWSYSTAVKRIELQASYSKWSRRIGRRLGRLKPNLRQRRNH